MDYFLFFGLGLKSAEFHFRKYKNFFDIRARKFHFLKYKECFWGWFFSFLGLGLGSAGFHFVKYKKSFPLRKHKNHQICHFSGKHFEAFISGNIRTFLILVRESFIS